MKVSYEWLSEILNDKIEPEKLLNIFPKIGMGVESFEKYDEDYIYEIEVTPNRPDLLGMIGIARQVSAFLGIQMGFKFEGIKPEIENNLEIKIESKEDCSRYGALIVDNIKVKDSPEWLKNRIEKSGIRALNNVVDISNYVMLLTGHPVHIFDATFVDKIVVRRGRKGEKIRTLDGIEREVEDILLICNSKEPIAIAGIMGGEDSSVHTKTEKVIIESAYFNPVLIRKGSKKLNLKTEASYRFERTADIGIIPEVLNVTGKLLKDLAGGRISSQIIDVDISDRSNKYIIFDGEKINDILGTEYKDKEMKDALNSLGFRIEGNKIFTPSYRRDIEIIEDIAEEVGILKGYDNIKRRFNFSFSEATKDEFKEIRSLKCILKGMGLNEAITLSFMEKDFEKRNLEFHYIKNPMWPEKNVMRTNLLYGLLNCAKNNINRGQETITIFEIGNVFLPEQELHIGIVISGRLKRRWFEQERKFDFHDIKGIFENIMENLNLSYELKDTTNPLFYSEQGLDIYFEDKKIGSLGLLNQNVIEDDSFGLEINLLNLLSRRYQNKYRRLNRYPFLKRDISLVVPLGLENREIMDIIIKKGEFIEDTELIDVYYGKGLPTGFKSFTYRIKFRKEDGTMTSKEADEITGRIVEELKKVNVKLREL